jgi:predicted GNAT superfamily acetyltransferase
MALRDVVVRPMIDEDRTFAWRLNESEVPHVASETWDEFTRLCTIAASAPVAWLETKRAGFLLAMTEEADYDSDNFLWFRARYRRFFYVDRLAVAGDARLRGVGRALYLAAERFARDNGMETLCCEVNTRPPNPGSMAFHTTLGFSQVGAQDTQGKTVAMLVKTL